MSIFLCLFEHNDSGYFKAWWNYSNIWIIFELGSTDSISEIWTHFSGSQDDK
jgi:hypothetical protein